MTSSDSRALRSLLRGAVAGPTNGVLASTLTGAPTETPTGAPELNKPVMWALELSSPARLVTMGMRADSVKEGDAVSVTFHPMKDGTRGGQFIQAVLPGGKQILRANARDENEQ